MLKMLERCFGKRGSREVRKAQNGKPVVNQSQTHSESPQPEQKEDCVEFHNLVWPFDEPREGVRDYSIFADRKKVKNPCGIFLGTSGAGKTVFAKCEIYNALREDPDCRVIVIDTHASVDRMKQWKSHYAPLASYAGGTFINAFPDSGANINPFPEVGEGYTVEMVAMLVCGLYESAIGEKRSVTTAEKAIIYRCLMRLYSAHSRFTAKDFFAFLEAQPEPEAKSITGMLSDAFSKSLPAFWGPDKSHDCDGRVLIYGVKVDYLNEYSGNKDSYGVKALLCCLSDAWSRVVANSKKGIRTWLYIDDVEHLATLPSPTEFVDMMFRKSADYNCFPTMILHGTFGTHLSDDMIYRYGTSGLMLIMNSCAQDRYMLAETLPLSQAYKSFINQCAGDWGVGEGVVIIEGKPYYFRYRAPYRLLCPAEDYRHGTSANVLVQGGAATDSACHAVCALSDFCGLMEHQL